LVQGPEGVELMLERGLPYLPTLLSEIVKVQRIKAHQKFPYTLIPYSETRNSAKAARRSRTDSLWLALASVPHGTPTPWTFRPSALHRHLPVSRSPLSASILHTKPDSEPPGRSTATAEGDSRDFKELSGVLPGSARRRGTTSHPWLGGIEAVRGWGYG
jgi:hypothetical protein